ncbi:hypothetical protein [Curtobacterium sp. MCLR17_042]|uniref:hypothetical protein n=1 Tax=Curtobacterium sp. MCLR17_042 TaxID=2175626 RepID=UPI000DAA3500|nr:hypothetical protein [Curtobacterium sp. MCLR17_042]PZE28356.1 hypothetical protein DEJ02_07790 [Curtobacterium sp. MCLR17_042]
MEVIMRYFPARTNPALWHPIRLFVTQSVLDYRPNTVQAARSLISTLTGYVLWAVHEMHAPLDRDDLFYPLMIRRYISSISHTESSKQTYESALYRLANVIGGLPDKDRPPSARGLSPVRSYTNRELADIDGWISVRKTPTKRRDASIIVGLAGGAGVRSTEMPTIRQDGIRRDTQGRTTVNVGGRNPRTVDVLPDWNSHFDDLLLEPPADQTAVLKSTSTVTGFSNAMNALIRGPHPAPDLTLLRETWLLRTLQTLPVADLMHQAGFATPASLTRYMPYLTPGVSDREHRNRS